MSRYFYCYSCRLKNFIKAFGVDYATKAINPNSKTLYFMFEKSEKLNAILEFWNECKYKFDNYPDTALDGGEME